MTSILAFEGLLVMYTCEGTIFNRKSYASNCERAV